MTRSKEKIKKRGKGFHINVVSPRIFPGIFMHDAIYINILIHSAVDVY